MGGCLQSWLLEDVLWLTNKSFQCHLCLPDDLIPQFDSLLWGAAKYLPPPLVDKI